jgi:thiopeptide-type bacteriocin biosynthesis protein
MIREELGVDARAERRLDEKFRRERALLETMLGTREAVGELADTLGAVRAVFDDRSRRMSKIVAALQALDRESRLSRDIEDIASSYVHMHVNRLIRSEPRWHELVIHDFLLRHYDTELKRVRQVLSRHPQEKAC